jgi:hypothetical protein
LNLLRLSERIKSPAILRCAGVRINADRSTIRTLSAPNCQRARQCHSHRSPCVARANRGNGAPLHWHPGAWPGPTSRTRGPRSGARQGTIAKRGKHAVTLHETRSGASSTSEASVLSQKFDDRIWPHLRDFVSALGPYEGLRASLVTTRYHLIAAMSSRVLRCEPRRICLSVRVANPALHEIDPRGAGRGEVEMVAGAFGEPAPDQRRLVGGVVVQDQDARPSPPSKNLRNSPARCWG